MLWPGVIFNTAPMQSSSGLFNTPHLTNWGNFAPFSNIWPDSRFNCLIQTFFKYETDCFQRLFSFPSLISFPSEWVYHLFCLICCIKYSCSVNALKTIRGNIVNALYNMKLSNQLTIIHFYPPQKLLFGSSSQKLETSRIPIPSNGTLPRLPTLRNICSSGES